MRYVNAGEKFGRLTVVGHTGKDKWGNNRCACVCECGREKTISARSLLSQNTRSCGCLQREVASRKGEAAYNWKGGRRETPGGYVMVYRDGKYVAEHQVVYSEYLGRPIADDESVHHKNGRKNDNRLENLELRGRFHGKGQTIPDIISRAVEDLRRYAPEKLNANL